MKVILDIFFSMEKGILVWFYFLWNMESFCSDADDFVERKGKRERERFVERKSKAAMQIKIISSFSPWQVECTTVKSSVLLRKYSVWRKRTERKLSSLFALQLALY